MSQERFTQAISAVSKASVLSMNLKKEIDERLISLLDLEAEYAAFTLPLCLAVEHLQQANRFIAMAEYMLDEIEH